MNIIGIIAEFNPLHKGHTYLIEKSKNLLKVDGVICVMSGNFVQRGEPAIIDKWNRAKIALKNGIDLVLELPTFYSLSSAEAFAYGSINLLNSLNIIDYLCFGSESGDIELVKEISEVLLEEPMDFIEVLKENLNKGFSFPAARASALQNYFAKKYSNDFGSKINEIIKKSNNILAIEYNKNLLLNNSKIKPFTIKRIGSNYNDSELTNEFASATAIRKHILASDEIEAINNYVPDICYREIEGLFEKNYNFPSSNDMFNYIKFKLLTNENNIKNLLDANEGIDNKIFNEINKSSNIEELILNVKSKRYTYTRISRLLTQYFIGFEQYNLSKLKSISCPYARVLGFNKTGAKILKQLKLSSNIPLYTKLPKDKHKMLQLDIQASNAYSLINQNIPYNSDYLISPIIL